MQAAKDRRAHIDLAQKGIIVVAQIGRRFFNLGIGVVQHYVGNHAEEFELRAFDGDVATDGHLFHRRIGF